MPWNIPDTPLSVPVYSREEVDELLKSLTLQTRRDFEVVIVEDSSSLNVKTL